MGDLDGSFSDFTSSDIDMMTGLKDIGLYTDDGDSPQPRKKGQATDKKPAKSPQTEVMNNNAIENTPQKQEENPPQTPEDRPRRRKRKKDKPIPVSPVTVLERKKSPPKKRRQPKLTPITLEDIGISLPPPEPQNSSPDPEPEPHHESESEPEPKPIPSEDQKPKLKETKTESEPKPKPKSKPEKEKPKPKQKLCFDYLLEDTESPRPTSNSNQDNEKKIPTPKATLEERVLDYLEAALKNMTTDVLGELQDLIEAKDNTESTVNAFISEITRTIRRELSFETETPDYVRASLSGFDTYSSGFIQAMTSIQNLRSKHSGGTFTDVRKARASVSARIPSLQEDYGSVMDSLSQEISEIQELRIQMSSKDAETDGKATAVMRRMTEMEVKEIMQRAEREILQINKDRFDYDFPGETQKTDVTHINRKLNELVRQLRTGGVPDSPTKHSMKRKVAHLADMIDKLKQMRDAYEYQHNVLCDVWSMITAYSRPRATPPKPAPVRETRVQEFIPDNTKTEVSISKLKSRLETARRDQASCLKKASSIIDQAKRTHAKHRHRKRHT